MRPLWDFPTVFEHIIPQISSPLVMTILLSFFEQYWSSFGSSFAQIFSRLIFGKIMLRIYFPVQRGVGLRMAGGGILPSNVGIHINNCITSFFVKKLSLIVNNMIPTRASYTIPITGSLLFGDTICLGMCIISFASAFVSKDWGTNIFISSPSKSALYGVVTERLSLNVDQGNTFTQWPMIDILCKEGCQLKSTKSSLSRCLSTM